MRKVIRRVMRRVAIRAVRGAMKRGAVWAGVSVLSVSQASFAAGAHDTHRFNPTTTTLALQVGQTPIQDEQSRTVSVRKQPNFAAECCPLSSVWSPLIWRWHRSIGAFMCRITPNKRRRSESAYQNWLRCVITR